VVVVVAGSGAEREVDVEDVEVATTTERRVVVVERSVVVVERTDAEGTVTERNVVVVAIGTVAVGTVVVVVAVGTVVDVVEVEVGVVVGVVVVVVVAAVTVAVDVDEAASLPTASCTAEFDAAESEVGAVYTTVTMSPITAAGEIVSTTVEPLIVIELIVCVTPPIDATKSLIAAEVA
jgi:hypothetical protein